MRVIWFYGTASSPTIRISPQSALQCPVPNQQHDHEGDLEIAGALTYQELLPLNNDARQRQMQEQALSESDGLTTSEMPACLASTSQRSSNGWTLRPVPTRAGSGQSDVCRDAGAATHHPLPVAQRDGD